MIPIEVGLALFFGLMFYIILRNLFGLPLLASLWGSVSLMSLLGLAAYYANLSIALNIDPLSTNMRARAAESLTRRGLLAASLGFLAATFGFLAIYYLRRGGLFMALVLVGISLAIALVALFIVTRGRPTWPSGE